MDTYQADLFDPPPKARKPPKAKAITLAQYRRFLTERLSKRRDWAERAICRIYERQTPDEQDAGETIEDNGIGFSGVDAGILSSFARRIKDGSSLSDRQLLVAFRAVPKYWRQLLILSDRDKLDELIKEL